MNVLSPVEGDICFIVHFLLNKPTNFNIKAWVFARSKRMFMCNLEVYLGQGTCVGRHGVKFHVVLMVSFRIDCRPPDST